MRNSGVYLISNTENSYVYVGVSLTLKERKVQHIGLLKKDKHPNKGLQIDWNTFGETAFIFKVVELQKPEDIDGRLLYVQEREWIAKLRGQGMKLYNIPREGQVRKKK